MYQSNTTARNCNTANTFKYAAASTMEIIVDPYKQTNLRPETGRLLIAEPYLSEPDFSRSVIFIADHGDEGTVGFAMNRPTNHTLSEVLPNLQTIQIPLYLGGPVQMDTLHLIHRDYGSLGGSEVGKGTYWGGSYNSLEDALNCDHLRPADLRIFAGYSGWGPGQLQKEIESGAWLVADADPDLLFSATAQDMWQLAIKALGSEFAYLSMLPIDPQLN